MRYAGLVLVLGALLAAPAAFRGPGPDGGQAPQGTTPRYHYPDFGYLPPAQQYEGRVSRLSQDYPQQLSATAPAVCTGEFEGVKKNWRDYLMKVRAYCFEGNVLAGDVEDDWRVQQNEVRKWYHMPWRHYGPNGREGVHGLTKEAPVQPRQLAWPQTYTDGQTSAVAFYNEFGGYAIGRVWKDSKNPDATEVQKEEMREAVRPPFSKVRTRVKEGLPDAPHMKLMHSATDAEEVDIRRNYLHPQGP